MVVFTLISCSDFLEVEPDLQVSFDEQLSTKSGVLEAYSGIYRDVEDLISSKYALYAEALGGNLAFTPDATDGEVSIFTQIFDTYNFSATEMEFDYDDYYDDSYNIINQVNLLLERSDGFTFFTSEELNQLQAELLTIRAFTHYQVTLLFAQNYNFTPDASHLGIIYNTSTLTAGEDFPARLIMAETYLKIQQDLDTALGSFNDNPLLSGPAYSYFNSQTTTAVYARIALQMNDWETARNYANTVILNSGINLMTTENYVAQWEQPIQPVSEIVLEFTPPLDSADGEVSSTIAQFYRSIPANELAQQSASGDILNLYTSNDIRSAMFIMEEFQTSVNGNITLKPYFFTKKFQDDAGTTYMRLSELYLIRAEANARLGNLSLALNDLNTIRTRANLEALSMTEDVLEEIFLERRRELAFENHLFFDILRYKKDVVRNLDCIADVCNLDYPNNFFIQPIPFDSIEQNENMLQNEGY